MLCFQELLAIQQNGPRAIGFFGTRNMGFMHQQLIEILSYAMVIAVSMHVLLLFMYYFHFTNVSLPMWSSLLEDSMGEKCDCFTSSFQGPVIFLA